MNTHTFNKSGSKYSAPSCKVLLTGQVRSLCVGSDNNSRDNLGGLIDAPVWDDED